LNQESFLDAEGIVDTRKLVFGLSVLLILAGILLALFTPGGLLNKQDDLTNLMGSFGLSVQRTSPGPIIGYVLLGLGAVGVVVAYAMKPPPRS
jgi:hypothetical protein